MICSLLSLILLAADRGESVTVEGEAALLTEVLADQGIAADGEPIALQVVLKGKDGTITPLLSDDASRALFREERLRHRRTRVEGRRQHGSPYVQVVSFQVEDHGKLRTPEYYCEICAISVRYPQVCPCCQGEMVLQMKPEEP